MTTSGTIDEADIVDRCMRSRAMLVEIRERLSAGDPTPELLKRLQSVWSELRAPKEVSPTVEALVAETQAELAKTIDAGSTWMRTAADQIRHLARGRQMQDAYTKFEER